MSFISYNNTITLEDIDLETNLIGVLLNNKYVTYSWIGGCWFRMDYDYVQESLYALGCKGQFVCDVTKIDSNIEYVLEDLV